MRWACSSWPPFRGFGSRSRLLSIGGAQPTVTDANLALGYYDPAFFLGGRMRLDKAAAGWALASVAEPLGLSIERAAWESRRW